MRGKVERQQLKATDLYYDCSELSKTSFKKTPRGPSVNGCTYKNRDTCTKTTAVMDLHTTRKSSWTYRRPKWRRRSRSKRWRLEVKRSRTVGHRKRTENPGREDDDPETVQGQTDQLTDSNTLTVQIHKHTHTRARADTNLYTQPAYHATRLAIIETTHAL